MDEADYAKIYERAHRDAAIKAQQDAARETEKPLIIDGVRHCIDCGDKIPAARLAARPESVRCIDCKEIQEKRSFL